MFRHGSALDPVTMRIAESQMAAAKAKAIAIGPRPTAGYLSKSKCWQANFGGFCLRQGLLWNSEGLEGPEWHGSEWWGHRQRVI